MGEGNGTGKHDIPPFTDPVWLARMADPKPLPKSDPPEEKFQKRLQWTKWLAGTVLVIFLGGFAVAQYLGNMATRTDVQHSVDRFKDDHLRSHVTLEHRMDGIESRTREIYGQQRVAAERQRLLDRRLELLLERSESPRRPAARRAAASREETLRREIERQERRVADAESADPMQQ